jgi:MFS family permease
MATKVPAAGKQLFGFNRNITLYLVMLFIANLGFGVVGSGFNLYILSMGMSPDMLGVILSLTPFAQMLMAIPIGFLAEKIGNKRGMILINVVVGVAYFMRVISSNQALILAGSFLLGAVQSGYFIMQMPFISHYAGTGRDKEFISTSITFYLAMLIGNLVGGYLPGMVQGLAGSETLAFRAVMTAASALILAGTIPLFFLEKDVPEDTSKISLSPYLKGIDKNTIKFAGIEFFIGTGIGFLQYFMNVIFVYYYASTLQGFGNMSFLMIFPMLVLMFVGPGLAKRFGGFNVVMVTRVIAAVLALMVIATTNQYIGGGSYMVFRALVGMGQTLWISWASTVATKRSRMATSTWLEITFQIGFGVSALYGGHLIAKNAYPPLGIISAVSMLLAVVLPLWFFGKRTLRKNGASEG